MEDEFDVFIVSVDVNLTGIPSACIHGLPYFLSVVLNLLTMTDNMEW